jgi:WD40 repeat protein
VAFIHYQHQQSLIGRVCLVGRDGKVQTLTDSFVNIHGLAWRGSQILFTASEDRPLFRSLRQVEPGSAMRTITRMPVNVTLWDASTDGRLLIAQTDDRAAMIGRLAGDSHDRDLSWLDASWVADLSPDGRTVLFTETGHGVGSIPAAYLRGTDGSAAVRLGSGQPLALSPDTRFALIMDVDGPWAGIGTSIDVVPTGAGEIRRVSADEFRYAGARWLPGGKGLLVKAHAKERPSRIFRVDLPGGRHVPLTPEGVGRWALSPDGTTIAATAADSSIQLYPLTGGAVRSVPDTTAGDSLIGWIEDGLLFMPSSDSAISVGEVYLHDPATGRRRPWANILPRDSAGIMLMGTFVATPDGGSCVFTWHRALSHLYLADGVV